MGFRFLQVLDNLYVITLNDHLKEQHSWTFSNSIKHARASDSWELMDKLILLRESQKSPLLHTTPIPTVSSSIHTTSTLILPLLGGGLFQFSELQAQVEEIDITFGLTDWAKVISSCFFFAILAISMGALFYPQTVIRFEEQAFVSSSYDDWIPS
ncbi:hypothetical protein PIB30_059856 [Stylosanthes scabra]|uniref:Uncharacterized protein n=1 Tax=Stylosanthes scabra TaxID=79078 RepID=A0ABU6ZJ47_9FABA|nr:hypothetical protein [Stylosanthes scabra]